MKLRTHFLKFAILIISFAIIVFGANADSYAAIYYVDNAANGSSNGTSWENAWESFANINWEIIGNGDTIFISGGLNSKTYYETLTIGKSFTSQITITAGVDSNHNGEVIIDGGGTRNYCVTSSGKDNWRLYKITVQNTSISSTGTIQINNGSDYVTIEECTVYHPRNRGIRSYNSDNVLIKNNIVDTTITDINQQQDGIYLQLGSNNVVDGNTVYSRSTASTSHVDSIQTNQETNLTIKNNWLEWTSAGNNDSQNTMITQTFGWLRFYNNVMIGNHTHAGQVAMIGLCDSTYDAQIYIWNNTFKSMENLEPTLKIYYCQSGYVAEVKNNVFLGQAGAALALDGSTVSNEAFNNNLYYTTASKVVYYGKSRTWEWWKSAGFDPNGIYANPGLDANLKPENGSAPVVDAGANISGLSTDIDGTKRPQGDSMDIGAYEYTSKLKPPSNLRIRISKN